LKIQYVCSNNKTNNNFNELIAYEIVKVIIVYMLLLFWCVCGSCEGKTEHEKIQKSFSKKKLIES
jgi:hypothetical protein